MGFPANLVTGEAVYIISKEVEGGGSEVELFTDQDGRKYTRHQSGGLVPVGKAEEAVEPTPEEVYENALTSGLSEAEAQAEAWPEATTEEVPATEEPYPGVEKAVEGVNYAPPAAASLEEQAAAGDETAIEALAALEAVEEAPAEAVKDDSPAAETFTA